MKAIRKTFFAAAFAAIAALTASAQTPAARPAAPAAAPSSSAAVADGKFAIIDTDAFGDQTNGIKRLVAALQSVEREFKPRRDELQTLRTRYEALAKEIQDTQKVADQKALAAKAEQAEGIEKEMKRKQEDGQAAYQKRLQELTEPIFRDLSQALTAFAKQRGITVVFDLSKLGGAMMVLDGAPDITGAFIADYNQRNPAATAATTPAARP